MLVISCFSVIAVNRNDTSTGAKSDVVATGNQLTKNGSYYLIGSFNGWNVDTAKSAWKLNTSDSNLYTGSFTISGSSTNYTFKIIDDNGKYYANSGYWFKSSNTVATGLNDNSGNSDMQIQCISSSKNIKIDVKLYCEYSGDSRLELTQTEVGGGDDPVTGITPGNKAQAKVYNANTNVIKDSSAFSTELISVNSSFYDYFMDTEVNGQWRTSLTAGPRDVKDGRDDPDRQPFRKFNKALGEYSSLNSAWSYPLYFGDFWDRADGYVGMDGSDLKKYKARPNNSQATTFGSNGDDASVSALTDTQLNSDNMLTANGVVLPYFDADWLTTNGYGAVVNSPFPLRKSQTEKGNDYYEFDSTNGTDNCYFNGYGSKLQMNYSKTHKVYDALSGFSNNQNGVGFFPFDLCADHQNNAYDFGFGMRLDIDFTLGENGIIGSGSSRENTQFTFSGDDDLWVYLDGVLVLDMGGDHKMSKGCIDFAELKSYVSKIDTTYSSDKTNALNYTSSSKTINGINYGYSASFPQLFENKARELGAFDNNDTRAKHKLTVFYMERGMCESNLKVGFNFVPAQDSLTVDKSVDVSNVNTALQNTVKNLDNFGYTVENTSVGGSTYTNSNDKRYTFNDSSTGHAHSAVTDGNKFSLANDDTAYFNGQFTPQSNIRITENNTPTDTKISTVNTDRILYFDPSGCSWFFNGSAVPAIAENYNGSDSSKYSAMSEYTTGGKTYYYAVLADDTTNFTLGRKTSNGVYNYHNFTVEADTDGKLTKNFVQSGSDWDNSRTYTTFTGTPISGSNSVIETSSRSKIVYTPSWQVFDNSIDDNSLVGSGSDSTALFKYFNKNNDEMLSTHMLVKYTNAVQTADIPVEKVVQDSDGNVIADDDTQFTVELKLDFNGGTNYQSYGLKHTISQNQPYTFTGIPQGATYQVVETDADGYTNISATGEVTGTVGATNNTVTVTNKKLEAEVTPLVEKYLYNELYVGNKFSFELEGVAPLTVDGATTKDTSTITPETVSEITATDAGKVKFSTIKFDEVGTYLYKITELDCSDDDYKIDNNTIVLKVVVALNNGNMTATPKYYRGTGEISEILNTTARDLTSFVNGTNPGKVTVVKTDKLDSNGNAIGTKIEGAEFTIYKVSGNGAEIDESNIVDSGITANPQTTDSNGEVTFDNLPIFEPGGNGNNNKEKVYQWYCVKETKAKPGYVLPEDGTFYFCFDDATYDSDNGTYTKSGAVVNQLITIPQAGWNFVKNHYFLVGGIMMSLASAFALVYYYSKRRKASLCRHGVNKYGRK